MSDLRFNSIAGAVLASVLGVMAVGVGADTIVQSHYPETAGYLPEVAAESTGGAPEAPSGPPDFGRLFADQAALTELVARGERLAGQCSSCHNFEAGGPNRTGPALHDSFGNDIAAHAGFNYSEALQSLEGRWDYLSLNGFLQSPASYARGTRMTFAGVRNEQDRVAIIAYLRSISPNQVPLPAPLPEAAPAEGQETSAPGPEAPPT